MKTTSRFLPSKARLVIAFAILVLGGVISLGQGCQAPFAGNGGGYGGMKPENGVSSDFQEDGAYAIGEARNSGGGSGSSSPALISTPSTGGSIYDNAYYSFSSWAVCSTTTPELNDAGYFVSGILTNAWNGAFNYRSDLCSPWSSANSQQMVKADFDPVSLVYGDRVFTHFASAPNQLSDMVKTFGYCLAIDSANSEGIDTGISATVYQKGKTLYASVYRGVFENGVYRRYKFSSSEVVAQFHAGHAEFGASGVNLRIETSLQMRKGAGVLVIPWRDLSVQFNVACWRFEQ